MSDADVAYGSYLEAAGYVSTNVNPTKLAYRGVLIERPCDICDTVDIHFEGRCNSGPCQFRLDPRVKCGWTRGDHERSRLDHAWTPGTYYPADFEWPDNEHSTNASDRTQEAFIRILDKARELGEPELYTSDLFRDYQKLMGLRSYAKYGPAPVRFVWAIRHHGCGTDLFTPDQGIHEYYTSNPHMAYFLYDGETHGPLGDLVECNLATARTVLATWRARELAMPGNHPFVEGCCFRSEEDH